MPDFYVEATPLSHPGPQGAVPLYITLPVAGHDLGLQRGPTQSGARLPVGGRMESIGRPLA